MAAIKQWEASDVEPEPRITMWLKDSILYVLRRYHYVDANGDRVFEGGSQVCRAEVQWEDVPQDIQQSLTTINDYINDKIDAKEGIVR